jgi:hypothetical protein
MPEKEQCDGGKESKKTQQSHKYDFAAYVGALDTEGGDGDGEAEDGPQ